jgi:hypothetical protein
MNIEIGATPKVTKSAKLSSYLPNSDVAFKCLARKPSKESKITAK